MAEIAVHLVLDKLGPLIKEEAYLLKGIHKEVDEIKCDLEYISAFLQDADIRAQTDQRINNHGVKLWVENLRKAAFKVEDVIDEYTYLMVQLQRPHNNRFIGFVRRNTCLVIKLKPCHDLASKIQDIKVNIEKIKKANGDFGFNSSLQQESTSLAQTNTWFDPRKRSRHLKETDVVGIESSIDELIGVMRCESSKLTVIPLVGMGGVGKTTLAHQLYVRTKETFYCHAWIEVSQSYDSVKLLQKLMKNLYESNNDLVPQGIDAMDETTVITTLKKYLTKKRYLVIFDDVWSTKVWADIKYVFPDPNDAFGRIVITTRDEEVAKFCKTMRLFKNSHIHHLQPLPYKKSWALFCNEAFQNEYEGHCPPDPPDHLKNLSHEIVEKCKGLPLAIVVVAGLLSSKDNDVNEWRTLLASLSSELENNKHLKSVWEILSLSYNDLPCNLKHCFLHFAIFPEDYSVRCGRLIRQWIAEGFVKAKDNKSLEVVAEEYLVELINRNLVQVSEVHFNGKAKTCQIHDLVREMIIKKAEDLSICQILSEEDSKFKGVTRRISIINGSYDDVIKRRSSENFQLRSIFIFDKYELPNHLASAITINFKLLKLLDFEDAPRLEHLPRDIRRLFHLKYLSVRGTKVRVLPQSIGELENLETLDLRQSLVFELPVEIKRLRKLRHLLAYHKGWNEDFHFQTHRGVNVHEGIRWLKSLHKLYIVEANVTGFNLFKELRELVELRKLGITKLGTENGKNLCDSIEMMKYLECLDVASIDEGVAIDLEGISSPPPSLQRLYLRGLLWKLPEWVTKLEYLEKVNLWWSKLENDPLQAFQNLHNLLELGFYEDAYFGEELHFKKGGFRKLKVLNLRSLCKLRLLRIEEGALDNLEELNIGSCAQLKTSSGFRHLRNMKNVVLFELEKKFLPHCLGFIRFTQSNVHFSYELYGENFSANMRNVIEDFFIEERERGCNDVDWDKVFIAFEDICGRYIQRRRIREALYVRNAELQFIGEAE